MDSSYEVVKRQAVQLGADVLAKVFECHASGGTARRVILGKKQDTILRFVKEQEEAEYDHVSSAVEFGGLEVVVVDVDDVIRIECS